MFNIFRLQSDVWSRAGVREYMDIRIGYEGGCVNPDWELTGVGEWN